MDAKQCWNYKTEQPVRVVCYFNGDEAELLLNGKKVGERKPYDPGTAITYWDVPYQPGELKVIAYRNGKPVATDAIKTGGKPYALAATVEPGTLSGARDVAVVSVSVEDGQGNSVCSAKNEVTCVVKGPGKLIGLENAMDDATENFNGSTLPCKNGRLTAYIQATEDKGTIDVALTSPALSSKEIRLPINSPAPQK